MRLLHATLAVLSLLHVGRTAPTTNCESLTQKIAIESSDPLLGKWMYIAESVNIPGARMMTKTFVDSVFVNFIPLADGNAKFTQIQKSFGSCMSISSTVRVANNTIQMTKPYKAEEVLLTTSCPDCLVIQSNFTLGSTYFQAVQLLSRRRMLSTAELDEFKKQTECLNLPAPGFLNPEKELCSEEQASGIKDLTAVLDTEMGSQLMRLLDSVINSPEGIAGFMNNIFGMSGTKGD